MLARALTAVVGAELQQQQTAGLASSRSLRSPLPVAPPSVMAVDYQHLAATDEIRNYNQEDDDEDNPDEEGEEAGALRLEEEDDDDDDPADGSLLDRLRPRPCQSAAGVRLGRNLRQDKTDLVAEGETAAAAAADLFIWRPFDSVPPQQQQQQQQQLPRLTSQPASIDISLSSAVSYCRKQQQPLASKPRIKKPLNAFMLYMRDHRASVAAEHSLRESAAINRLLGRQWQTLSRQEQARYYYLAQIEKDRHSRLHPNWSAKDNYGSGGGGLAGSASRAPQHKSPKQQQKRQQKQQLRIQHSFLISNQSANGVASGLGVNKKCRAVYGLNRQDLWCRPCRRKKRCARFGGSGAESERIEGPESPT